VIKASGIGYRYSTAYQIKKNLPGEYIGSCDVYRMIKELAPSKYMEDDLLLNLKDFCTGTDDGRYKRNLIKKVNTKFNLNWETGRTKDEIKDDNERVIFERADDNRCIVIYHDTNNAIAISLDPAKQYGYADLTIFDGGKKVRERKQLIVKRNRKTILGFYTIKHSEKIVRYLDVDLKDSAKQSVSKIKEQVRSECTQYNEDDIRDNPEILEIHNNRDNWLCRTNFRGFLTFLASESKLKDSKSKKEIHQLLSMASSEWIAKEAPFLDCWQYFEKVGFDVIRTLRNIGAEFINQVNDENIDNDYLLTRVTERCYDAVSFYFRWFGKSLFLARYKKYIQEYDKYHVHDKLHRYRLETLKRLRKGFIQKIESIDRILESDTLSMSS
jgi:hypothetical protein